MCHICSHNIWLIVFGVVFWNIHHGFGIGEDKMFVLIVYDISENNGSKRLRKVSKCCERYGVRVQNSVFECDILYDKVLAFEHELTSLIDGTADSVCLYYLGKKSRVRKQVLGIHKNAIELSENHGFFV